MRPARSSGSPPRYRVSSRSRISLSPGAVYAVLTLFTEMVPVSAAGHRRNMSSRYDLIASHHHHQHSPAMTTSSIILISHPFPSYSSLSTLALITAIIKSNRNTARSVEGAVCHSKCLLMSLAAFSFTLRCKLQPNHHCFDCHHGPNNRKVQKMDVKFCEKLSRK